MSLMTLMQKFDKEKEGKRMYKAKAKHFSSMLRNITKSSIDMELVVTSIEKKIVQKG
jgi:hypothetical protein